MNLMLWIAVFILAITLVFGWGFMLWILAELLSRLFNIVGFVYSIISNFVRLKWNTGRKTLNQYFYDLALSKDQHANVVLRDFFNKIMLKKLAIPFGDPDLSLSWYFAVNKLIMETSGLDCGLSRFGLFWAKFLDLFEKSKGGHLHHTIFLQMNRENDILTKQGLQQFHVDIDTYKTFIVDDFEANLKHLF
jgi:hypothetical protein